jgi:DNA-binding ferritin-like protein
VGIGRFHCVGSSGQAYENVVGGEFRDHHLNLDGVVAAAQGIADAVAERMRAPDAVSNGREGTYRSYSRALARPVRWDRSGRSLEGHRHLTEGRCHGHGG